MKPSVIALTGGIASGKSSVLRWLLQQGCSTLDADLIARQVVEPEQEAWRRIVELFGKDILQEDCTLDRKKLAAIIFDDSEARRRLNQIVHPAVIERLEQGIAVKKSGGEQFPPLILDIPLLFEAGLTALGDQIWVIYTAPEVQLERLIKRDGLSEEAAQKRIVAQWPLQQKCDLADRVIDNSGSWFATERQLQALWQEMKLAHAAEP